jgi:predicted MPP superfamily phosphohydrolase
MPLAVSAACLSAYILFVEPRWFRIRKIRIAARKPIPKPISILHLSDTHFCGKYAYKEAFFESLRSVEADFIFVTGDIIDHDGGIDQCAEMIGNLKARYAKCAVLGNHDYWDYRLVDNVRYHLRKVKRSSRKNDVPRLRKTLEQAGVHVLVNESREFRENGTSLVVAGTDDPVTHKVDFASTLALARKDSFNILLTHVLDSILKLGTSEVDLVLAGHTHGGQIRLPFLGGFCADFRMPRRYIDGLNEYQGITTFVSRGIGAGRILTPRFCCRPEAVLIEITPSR